MSTARRWIDAASFRLACGIGGIVQAELATMADAQPFWSNGPPQTPTPQSRKNL